MIYTGKILDANAKPIPGAMVIFRNDAGANVAGIETNAQGIWTLDTDFDNGLLVPGMQIIFAAPGFLEYGISPSALQQQFNVTLVPKPDTIFPWMIVAVLAAVMIVTRKKKRRGTVGRIEKKDVTVIFYILGGVIAFTLVQKILRKLGIWKSPNDDKLAQIQADTTTFWNPNYYNEINPSGTGWTYALTWDQAVDLLGQIVDAFGLFGDNEEKIYSVFRQLKTKANVSFMAYVFKQEYDRDLLSYLSSGPGLLPWVGLNSDEIVFINDMIAKLPNY